MLSEFPIVSDGDPGGMTIPLEHEDVRTVQTLPNEVKKEVVRNIRQYVKQLGKEYGSTQPVPDSTVR